MRRTISLALASGLGAAASAQPTSIAPRTLKPWPVANISYNLRTGERLVTPLDARPRNNAEALWLNTNADPCGEGGVVFLIDNPDADGDGLGDIVFSASPTVCDAMPTVPCEGSWFVWPGDVGPDTVVDCVVIAYAIAAPDTDDDHDGVGDGIEGYDLFLTFSDDDQGYGTSARSCILDLRIPDLPGAPPGIPPGYMALYHLTLDLANTAPSFVFELGDSDAIDDAGTGFSGGAIYAHPTFSDRDGDGLDDFSYAVRFDQSALPVPGQGPGRTRGANGFLRTVPVGCTDDSCAFPLDPPGIQCMPDIYTSGPSCPPDITDITPMNFPLCFICEWSYFMSNYIELYGAPSPSCSLADNALPLGVLDFSDVLGFMFAATPSDPSPYAEEFAPPRNVFNIDDVLAFLTLFAQGCP
ncbi:MAG: hypothetical protein R3B57_06455 [Phycisphaerales bacterium]